MTNSITAPLGGEQLRPFGERDDYANSKVPPAAKRGLRDFFALSSGAVTSIFVFAFGSTTAMTYGLTIAIAMAVVGLVVSSLAAIVIVRATAASSMGVDLLSRGAGFGYLGASVNILIFIGTFIAYAAFETSFIASAVHEQWPAIPLWVLYLVASFALIPLCWRGAGQVAWLQRVTVPLFFLGAIALVVLAAVQPAGPEVANQPFTVPTFLQALALPLSITPLIAITMADYGRFIAVKERRRVSTLGAAGTVLLWSAEFAAGAFIASRLGAADPGVYTAQILGVVGVAWIILTQLKVQFANYYGASVSMANFASRFWRTRDLRRPFLFVIAAISFVAALAGMVENLGYIANLLGIGLSAWASLLILDAVIRTRGRGRFGISWVEHRRAHLRDWGVAALAGLLTATAVGLAIALTSVTGPYSGTLSILAAWVIAPAVSLLVGTIAPNPVRGIAPAGWRDDDAGGGDAVTVCDDCGASGPQHDAVQLDTTVRCSQCDATAR